MRRILAATDFSARADRALRRAGMLARRFSADLTLLHVVDDDQPPAQVDRARAGAETTLKEKVKTVSELQDLDCRLLVVTADPFDGILQAAKSTAAELIVMGSHRKQLLQDVFLGTTIERVIRAGPRPVLMVNREPAQPYRRALAAVDLSDSSMHAVRTGVELSLLEDVDLTVVRAFTAPEKSSMYLGGAAHEDIERHILDEQMKLRTELRSFVESIGMQQNGLSFRVGEGDPYEVIEAVAQDMDTDLVIIGTHGRTGIAKVLLGSVASQVLSRLDTDILAVPTPRG